MVLATISELLAGWDQYSHCRYHYLLDLKRYVDAEYNRGSPVLPNSSYDSMIQLLENWRNSTITTLNQSSDIFQLNYSLQELQDIKNYAHELYKNKTPVLTDTTYNNVTLEINKRITNIPKLIQDVQINSFVSANWTDTQLFDVLHHLGLAYAQSPLLQNNKYDIVAKEHTMREKIKIYHPTVPFPAHWNFPVAAIDIIELQKTDKEYISLANGLLSSLPKAVVHSIKRIQNYGLYRLFYYTQFLNAKYRKIDPSKVVINSLYHGCPDPIGVSEIISHGFYQRFCPGGLIGDGCYFAINASYSNSNPYVLKLPDGSRQLFIVNVITGISADYNSDGILLKQPKPLKWLPYYDTVNDGPSNMYCIFDHYQAYPAYTINYSV